MFFEQVEKNSLESLWRGRRRRQCPCCFLTKTILECTLAKLMAWNLSFFPVQACCAACSSSFPLSLIACTPKDFCAEHILLLKGEKNHWMFEKLIDKDFFFFTPWSFKCFQQCFLIVVDNATDPFTNHCTHWRVKLYTQLKLSFLATFWQLLF